MKQQRGQTALFTLIRSLFAAGLLAVLSAGNPTISAAQPDLRSSLLALSADSIRVGQYAWAESQLQIILASDSTDELARMLFVVAIAGQGDFERARGAVLGIASDKRRSDITKVIERFAIAHDVRIRFQAAIAAGDVRAAAASLDTDALGSREVALARGALCVLAGDRECLDGQMALVNADADQQARALLYAQLADADSLASVYAAALRPFTGRLGPPAEDWLSDSTESRPHRACNEKRREDEQRCRQELFVRLMSISTDFVAAAPLSASGLDASVMVAMLTEDLKSFRAAVDRSRLARGEVVVPLWQMTKWPETAAFNKKLRAERLRLRVAADTAFLEKPTLHTEHLEPLKVKFASAPGDETLPTATPIPPRRVWALPLSALQFEKTTLRQKISWDGGRGELGPAGLVAQLRAEGHDFEVPYPAGLYHFSMAYGEVPSRAVFRNFGTTLGSILRMRESQVELVDSVKRQSGFSKAFKVVMVATAAAVGHTEAVGFWSNEIAEAERKEAQQRSQRRQWISTTQDNVTLRSLFDLAVREEWLEYFLRELGRGSSP